MFIRQLASMLHVRKQSLERLKAKIMQTLASLPEGHLNISPAHSPGKGYVYYRSDGLGHRIYINKNSDHLAEKLAQKEYYLKLMKRVEKEIRLIDRYLKFLSHDCPEDLYPSLPEARKAIVTPFIDSDEDYISKWKAHPYTGKSFSKDDPEHYSESGLRVRSKSEELIANALDRLNIPYRYECPITLSNWGDIYPDFTVLNVGKRKEIIWEHFGMMDNAEYAAGALKKISNYIAHHYYPGDNLILTFESSDVPISTRQITEICKHYFI